MLSSTVDFLKVEIERKRKERQELEEAASKKAKIQGNEEGSQPRKKYVRNADLERERERKYLEEMHKVGEMFVTMIFKQNTNMEQQTQEDKIKKARTSPTPLQKEQETKHDDKIEIPLEEAFRRLRALGQPITLFGETEAERIERLRRVEEVDSEKTGGQRDEIRDILKELEGKDDEKPPVYLCVLCYSCKRKRRRREQKNLLRLKYGQILKKWKQRKLTVYLC